MAKSQKIKRTEAVFKAASDSALEAGRQISDLTKLCLSAGVFIGGLAAARVSIAQDFYILTTIGLLLIAISWIFGGVQISLYYNLLVQREEACRDCFEAWTKAVGKKTKKENDKAKKLEQEVVEKFAEASPVWALITQVSLLLVGALLILVDVIIF